MKTLLLLALTLAVAACAYTPDRRYGGVYGKGYAEPGQDRVLVCHKGKTMELPMPALNGHLGHCDYRGPCR